MVQAVVGRWVSWTLLAAWMLLITPVDSTAVLAQGTGKQAVTRRWRRLPPYYAKVVTEEQRAAIYEIQEEYGPKIAVLQKQIADLKAERNKKIKAVLTPQQQQKIEDAKQKRKEMAAAKRAGKGNKTTPPADSGDSVKPSS